MEEDLRVLGARRRCPLTPLSLLALAPAPLLGSSPSGRCWQGEAWGALPLLAPQPTDV